MLGVSAFALSLAGCGGGGSLPPNLPSLSSTTIVDAAVEPCTVSYDRLISYRVPAGSFAPIEQTRVTCPRAALSLNAHPPIPSWAKPLGSTQAIFVATSLQENYVPGGMETMESVAAPHHVPMSWMIGSGDYIATSAQVDLYDSYHTANGDDIEIENGMGSQVQPLFPWFTPGVSAEPGGRGRTHDPSADLALGEHGFWGITWNSLGTDGIEDYGSPWGSYCADVSSYKRPAPDGSCNFLAFEWTARDLTRAYFSGKEAAFSTDPDDLQLRAGFTEGEAANYISQMVDAYAAAGASEPIVMMSQQESAEAQNPGDAQIMDALYTRAVADGMKVETLRQAVNDAQTFSARPRAIAFPFITGGNNVPSQMLSGNSVYPATIDYHDATSGMTFIAGETTASRVFRYADYPASSDPLPLPQVPAAQLPTLSNVAVANGQIVFHFVAPVALHYGVALWTDPANLGLSGAGVVPAGHAGVVLVFDLQTGPNDVAFACARCTSTTFTYSY